MEIPLPATTATGEVSYLARLVLTWFFSDDGFKSYSREAKIDKITALIKTALDERQLAVATVLLDELRSMSLSSP